MPSMDGCSRRVGMLSNEDLDEEALRLTGVVQRSTAELIVHLAEIGRRDLHLRLGYSSLFTYCTGRLGMSEAQAGLRTQVARVCREFPAVLVSIAANRMNLSIAGRIAPHLTPGNAGTVIRDCEGMSRREVDEYVVRFRPKREVGSGARRVPSRTGASAETEGVLATSTGEPSDSGGEDDRSDAKSPAAVPAGKASRRPTSRVEPASPTRHNFYFAGGTALRNKIERLGEVLGVRNPLNHLEQLLEVAIDIAIEKKDPRKKHERRQKREAKNAREAAEVPDTAPSKATDGPDASEEHCPDKVESSGSAEAAQSDPSPSRAIPAAVRDFVLDRADYRCEFVGPNGTRCTERTGLEVDHVHPFAMEGHGPEGPHHESNLRCLCRAHNQWCAEQAFGREFIQAKIDQRRRAG